MLGARCSVLGARCSVLGARCSENCVEVTEWQGFQGIKIKHDLAYPDRSTGQVSDLARQEALQNLQLLTVVREQSPSKCPFRYLKRGWKVPQSTGQSGCDIEEPDLASTPITAPVPVPNSGRGDQLPPLQAGQTLPPSPPWLRLSRRPETRSTATPHPAPTRLPGAACVTPSQPS